MENIYKLHPDLFSDKVVFSQMTEFSLEGRNPTKVTFIDDSKTSYNLNSFGFRSPEFSADTDILVAGCSQTVGLGVDSKDLWAEILSKSLGMSYANLGVVGCSIGGMCELIMAHIRDYGKPKVICALLPGLYRMILPINKDVNVYVYNKSNKDLEVKNINLSFASEGILSEKTYPSYSKKPHSLNDVLPYEVALHQSMMALGYLIEYCKAANIKLVLSSWEVGTTKFLLEKSLSNNSKLDLSSFIPLDGYETFFYSSSEITCHKEISGETRDKGRDSSGHMGAHQHAHIAELFASAIKKL